MSKLLITFGGLGVLALVFGAYQLGHADQEAGVDHLTAPALYAADANTIVGLEAGTVLPQERQKITPALTVAARPWRRFFNVTMRVAP